MSKADNAPRLTACMIARDEADILGQCLESIRDLVDEIVLVDTGSRDDTAHVAALHGAVVRHLPWRNDFGLARNASLELARGDWVLVMDADEILDRRFHGAIRAFIDHPGRACTFDQRTYTTQNSIIGWKPNDGSCLQAAAFGGFVSARQVRLLPRDPRLRYRGAVHEDLEASLSEAGVAIEHPDIVVHHFGKVRDEAVMARKQALYTELGERKLKAHRDDPRAWFELGVQYAEVGRRQEAVDALTRVVSMDALPYFRGRAVAFLGAMHLANGETQRALDLLGEGLRRDPELPELWYNLAHAHARSGSRSGALEVLEEAGRVFPSNSTLTAYAGELYLETGQWDRARKAFLRVRRFHPASGIARRGLALLEFLVREDTHAAEAYLKEGSSAEQLTLRTELAHALLGEGRPDLARAVVLRGPPSVRGHLTTLLAQVAAAAGDRHLLAQTLCGPGVEGATPTQAAETLLEGDTLPWALHLLERSPELRSRVARSLALARLGAPALGCLALRPWAQVPAVAAVCRRLEALQSWVPAEV